MPTDTAQPNTPNIPVDYSQATFNPQYQAKMPQIKSTIVQLRNQGVADDKIFSYLSQKGVLQMPKTTTPSSQPQPELSLGSRVSSDIQSSASDVNTAIEGTGDYQNKSTLNRATGAVSSAFGGVAKTASELLPQALRDNLKSQDIQDKVQRFGPGLVGLLSDSKTLQQWASDPKNADAVNKLTDVLGTVSNLGNISGTILGAEGGVKAIEATPKVAQGVIDTASIGGEKTGINPKTVNASLQDSLDMTRPVLDKKGSIQALEKSGLPGGAQKTGKLGAIDTSVSPKDTTIAQTVQPHVIKGDPISSISNINQEIERSSTQDIRPFLQKNPAPFNMKQIGSYIKTNTEIPNYIKADPVLQKTYDLTRQSMLDEISKQPKNMEGLWDARISFDNVAQRQGVNLNTISEKASVIKQAVMDTRRAVNSYIIDNTPNVDGNFKSNMEKLTNLYEGRSRIAEANYKSLGTNAVQRWIKANPTKARIAKYSLAGIAGVTAEKTLKTFGVPVP